MLNDQKSEKPTQPSMLDHAPHPAGFPNKSTGENETSASKSEVNKVIGNLKMIKRIQWLVCLLAIVGLLFAIRINEYCDRGYQPTEVCLIGS